MQWFSLMLLTAGCMVKHFDTSIFITKFHVDISLLLILVQVNWFLSISSSCSLGNTGVFWKLFYFQTICSCLAGVYNEYLLKRQGADINIFVQNVFMYIDSILCNVVAIAALNVFKSDLSDTFNDIKISASLQPIVILIMLNNAFVGIITSFFLKNLNSILKTFASAMELIFTALVCWILFNIPVNTNTVISIAMVSFAVVLYSRNPVQNTQPKDVETKSILV